MVKRIAKYGFKSGILPKPRQIVEPYKTRKELEELAKANVGFRDPELIPKGVKAAVIPLKPRVTIDTVIAHSAKQPQPGNKSSSSRAQWRQDFATKRREYLVQALTTQDRAELCAMKKREARELRDEEEARKKADPELTKQSQSTLLTLPTIEAFLNNTHSSTLSTDDKAAAGSHITSINDVAQFVVPRTPAEQKLLLTQRKANRVRGKLAVAESRAKTFLELYQRASSFATTEEQLDKLIEKEFPPASAPTHGGFPGASPAGSSYNKTWDPSVIFGSSSYASSSASPFGSFAATGYSSSGSSVILSTSPAFSNDATPPRESAQHLQQPLSDGDTHSLHNALIKELYGVTSNTAPGLAEVEDAISGATVQHHKALAELAREQERLSAQVEAERQ